MYSRSKLVSVLSKKPGTSDEFKIALESEGPDGGEFTRDDAVGVFHRIAGGVPYSRAMDEMAEAVKSRRSSEARAAQQYAKSSEVMLITEQYLRDNPGSTRDEAFHFARSGNTVDRRKGKRYELSRSEAAEVQRIMFSRKCSYEDARAEVIAKYGRKDDEAVCIHYGRDYGHVTFSREDERKESVAVEYRPSRRYSKAELVSYAQKMLTPAKQNQVGQKYTRARKEQPVTYSRFDEPSYLSPTIGDY